MDILDLDLTWLRNFKEAEGRPTTTWIENEEDRHAVGRLRRDGLIERRGYSESGMSTFYYLTEKGNAILEANSDT